MFYHLLYFILYWYNLYCVHICVDTLLNLLIEKISMKCNIIQSPYILQSPYCIILYICRCVINILLYRIVLIYNTYNKILVLHCTGLDIFIFICIMELYVIFELYMYYLIKLYFIVCMYTTKQNMYVSNKKINMIHVVVCNKIQ